MDVVKWVVSIIAAVILVTLIISAGAAVMFLVSFGFIAFIIFLVVGVIATGIKEAMTTKEEQETVEE